MALPLKNRTKITIKKVLILGYDGTGKSTYAEKYCNDNHLKPIVIDIDDTNYTDLPIIDLKEYLPSNIGLNYDKKYYDAILKIIKDIQDEPEYDTIIIDGISSLIEILTSKAKGLQKYGDRKDRFDNILLHLEKTERNLIFVGQKDIEPIHGPDKSSNQCVFKINSIVNEKYECYKENNQFLVDTRKSRTPSKINHKKEEEKPVTAEPVLPRKETPKPQINNDFQIPDPEPLRTIINQVNNFLKNNGTPPTRKNIWIETMQRVKDGRIKKELKDDLQEYIMSHCPEELD